MEKKLVDLFNSHYINIVKISSGIITSSYRNINRTDEIQLTVNLYKDHQKPVIFCFEPTTIGNVKKLLNEIDTKKVLGIDTILHKLIKMTSNFLAPILTTAISSSIEDSECVSI